MYPGAGDPIRGLDGLQNQLASTLWEGIPAKSQSNQYCPMYHVIYRLRDKNCKTRTYPGGGDPISGIKGLQGQLASTLWKGIWAKSQSHHYCLMQHVI